MTVVFSSTAFVAAPAAPAMTSNAIDKKRRFIRGPSIPFEFQFSPRVALASCAIGCSHVRNYDAATT